MRIVVTKKDIELAYKAITNLEWVSYSCPISQSLIRRGFSNVRTFLAYASFNNEVWALPYEVRKLIDNFASGKSVNPTKFTIHKI